MISSDKRTVQLIIDQCLAHGVTHFVLSPGSRNAPFAIALDAHPSVECVVIHDERSAAFFALGMAQQLGKPVGIVCTSGSAPLNYYPAVAEAYYQCVPLVVITADRPYEWIDQGDGQTIRQKNVFEEHVRYSCHFQENVQSPDERWYVERETAIAFAEGNGFWKGPIHFNIAFREPLYGTIREVERASPRIIHSEKSDFSPSSATVSELLKGLQLQKKLVIVGQMEPNPGFLKELSEFASDSSVAVLVENTSNAVDPAFIHCIDRTLNRISDAEMENFAPDLIVTVGGAVVSKRIKSYLRKNKPQFHWKIGSAFPYMDTYQSLTHTFDTDPSAFFKVLNGMTHKRSVSNYGGKWRQLDHFSRMRIPDFFQEIPYSDMLVFQTLFDVLPEKCQLHMGNSSVVRYCQLFDPITSVKYWSNRGTSGIDGSTSTAAGASYIAKNDLHVLITGDVSFFYDSNGLWNSYLKSNLRIVLINNGGGGIFRIITGPAQSPQLEQYFEAAHSHSAKGICESYKVNYESVVELAELDEKMVQLFQQAKTERPSLLEIFTDAQSNAEVLERFFSFLRC
jgi:2-succinyl-5-enolpyruvyl-6-hydroxy-3-cyclohexene-1-carboxylate synthase